MQILDHTPFRTESGEIDILGRIKGMLKFGMSWYERLKAQDSVIAIIDKPLGNAYTLLRNITLPDTEITLPMILIGPAGIFLINVAHERGVYRAREDEWGTIINEQFVPARINQIVRTKQMARVLQVYLDRQGYKGMLTVDPILMAADPGMHIESVRPSIRIVMSDALERFAISIAQARGAISPEAIPSLARIIVIGRPHKEEPVAAPEEAHAQFSQASGGFEESTSSGSGEMGSDFGFSFQDEEPAPQTPSTPQQAVPARSQATEKPVAKPKPQGIFGLTNRQLIILGSILAVWICLMIVFIVYIFYTLNA